MKLNKSIYGILITTCVFVMIFAIIMIVLSAIKMANTLSVTKYVFTIIAFVGVFLLAGIGDKSEKNGSNFMIVDKGTEVCLLSDFHRHKTKGH